MSKKYLVTDSNLFYTDEHYMNTNQGGDNPIFLFNSFEEALKEKEKLELNKIRGILQREPLIVAGQYWQDVVYVEDDIEFWKEVKEELKIGELDLSNDEKMIEINFTIACLSSEFLIFILILIHYLSSPQQYKPTPRLGINVFSLNQF